jgi:hypothetical protein
MLLNLSPHFVLYSIIEDTTITAITIKVLSENISQIKPLESFTDHLNSSTSIFGAFELFP